jgi:hypothetical protein
MWIIVYLDINLHSCPTQLLDAGKHSEGQIYTLCDPIPVTSFQKLFILHHQKQKRCMNLTTEQEESSIKSKNKGLV